MIASEIASNLSATMNTLDNQKKKKNSSLSIVGGIDIMNRSCKSKGECHFCVDDGVNQTACC